MQEVHGGDMPDKERGDTVTPEQSWCLVLRRLRGAGVGESGILFCLGYI